MNIRQYQPGDELAQVEIYNAAAADLPRFKATTRHEVLRRIRTKEFDPATRLYAEKKGRLVGYGNFQANGRIGFPWCRPGEEDCAEPLFAALMDSMRKAGIPRAMAAYRGDWERVLDFFAGHGFEKTRDMCNYILNLVDMPTPSARQVNALSTLAPEDLPILAELGKGVLRTDDLNSLNQIVFHNPLIPPESYISLRSRNDGRLVAVGLIVVDLTYAHPAAVDPDMPCFRLGAFGTENMTHKRINGLFSFLARPDANLHTLAMDLLGQAAYRLRDYDEMDCIAGQVPSDAPHLLNFFERNFQRQGSFPILEKDL